MSKSDLENLRKRTVETMNGLLWTYKTHYKMAEYYETWGRRLNIATAGGTGVVATAIIFGGIPQWVLFLVSLIVAFLSWANIMMGLGVKAKDHYFAGDRYHSLFEEYRNYFELELEAEEVRISEAKRRYEVLSERREELNLDSPRTTNKRYGTLESDEVYGTMETTQEEFERITGVSTENHQPP